MIASRLVMVDDVDVLGLLVAAGMGLPNDGPAETLGIVERLCCGISGTDGGLLLFSVGDAWNCSQRSVGSARLLPKATPNVNLLACPSPSMCISAAFRESSSNANP